MIFDVNYLLVIFIFGFFLFGIIYIIFFIIIISIRSRIVVFFNLGNT